MILMLQVFDKYSNSNPYKHMKTGNKNYFAPSKGFEHHFLYSVKQLTKSSLILFIVFLENKMRHCYLNSYFSTAVPNPFVQDDSRAKTG